MLLQSLALSLAIVSAQPNDPTTAPRNAFTACLRRFIDQSVNARTSASAFAAALPQQCQAEERAFGEALRAREAAYRTPAAEVEQTIREEVEDARSNARQLFEMATTPR